MGEGKLLHFLVCIRRNDAVCRLHICTVSAFGTDNQSILADGCEKHKLVRNTAAHHARVGFDRNYFRHARARKNALVRSVATCEVFLKVSHGGVEGICILHCELAHANHACARSCLIAELGLNLVDHKGVL